MLHNPVQKQNCGGESLSNRQCFVGDVLDITDHRLDHVGPLHAETLDGLEHVQQALRLHPLQDVAERDEGSGSPRARTAATKTINTISDSY